MLQWLSSPTGGLSLAPALVAIVLALVTRRVELALAFGVLIGGVVAAGGAPIDAIVRVAKYVGGAIGWSDGAFSVDHVEISAFSLLVAATVGVMGASGGTRAVIRQVERLAKGRRGAMVSAWLGGMVVFFDDYANCLVVGNAMGPLADRYGVSRQKLAYIVDSTAAPIASLAIVSTWVGYEVGLIADQLPAGGPNAFSVFLASVPYRFYSILTLVFVGAIALSNRDFGPMWHAEAAARPHAAEEDADDGASPWLAAVPVGLLVAGTLGWLVIRGWAALDPAKVAGVSASLAGAEGFAGRVNGASAVLGAANPYHAMLFGSLLALTTAVAGALAARRLEAGAVPRIAWDGARQVADALLVLYLAWALSNAMGDTGASKALTGLIDGTLPAWSLPGSTFVLAAATAFATGTSFGTMGILIPIALPVALQLAPGDLHILYGTTAAVLAGSCLGDHASPISDTTILSAVGSGTSLVEHVRTQTPYALSAGVLALVCGYLPVGLGVSVWACLAVGSVATVALVLVVGRPVPPADGQRVERTK
ncbi:MAG: Na+/H+ antiporter NhaC family protein [Alphaproteobacteria bacterium]|nr:Na+/H+ antiporter NhaC family protein [Alphaproteobacteria bacterium]MCB9690514.1 Na+/H+ antiporter NhaC family protein [Alphaproteobacteria bacterium]